MRNFIRCTAFVAGLLGGAAQVTYAQPPTPRQTTETASTSRVATTAPTAAPDDDARPERRPASLTAGEIRAGVAPHARDIQRCYRDELGDTHATQLELTLVIAYNGRVRSAKANVPGLPAKAAQKMASCMRTALVSARFPERRSDTMAVLPYVFQKTDAPDAGPQLSCWNRKGCS
jgi:hypothetical protein